MAYSDELLLSMSQEMGMRKAQSESTESFRRRVVYSALGEWIKAVAFDQTNGEEIDSKNSGNASKVHITKRVSKILDKYIAIFPEISDYFLTDTKNSIDCISEIRNRLLDSGILVSAEDNTVQYPPLKAVELSENIYLYRGNLKFGSKKIVIGLGTYANISAYPGSIVSYENMFNLTWDSAKDFAQGYLKIIETNFKDDNIIPESRKFFNCYSSYAISKSWQSEFPSNQIVTVYQDNLNSYGVIRKTDSGFQTSSFPSAFLDVQDIRRFIYGLWAIEKRSPKVRIDKQGAISYVHLPSHLPKKEQDLLYLIAWPMYNYLDKTNYMMPTAALPILTEIILKKLNLEVEYI